MEGHIEYENNGLTGECFIDAEENPYHVKTMEEANSGQPIHWTHPDGLSTMERLKSILSCQCIATHCMDLTIFINQTPIEELSACYTTIVENVFGFNNQMGLNLKTLSSDNSPVNGPRIMNLLGPEGPIIGLAYRLMADPDLVYEFPISCLPLSLERRVMRNEIPPYVASKLQKTDIIGINFGSPKLLLNAFEFFFFHYAFLELGSTMDMSRHMAGWAALSETLYSNLLDDYLKFFFPCSGAGLPQIPNVIRPIDNRSSFTIPTQSRRTLVSPESGDQRPKLFKASMYQDESLFRDTGMHPGIPTRQKEIWRTETILNIFVTMWLSIDNDMVEYQFETLLPSVDLVKSVRTIVRHLHYFINCVATHVNHPLEEILRSGWPMFQKKIYLLLRYLFTRWPLDNSFRIVYETWLSYLQPWRYLQYGMLSPVAGSEQEEILLEGRFQAFILENVLAYTRLFQQIIPRILRSDLTSIRNAHMLYRIAKVYMGVEALKRTLLEIERSLSFEPYSSRLASFQSSSSLNIGLNSSSNSSHYVSASDITPIQSPLLTSSGHITKYSPEPLLHRTLSSSRHPLEFAASGSKLASVRQLMIELEGPNFNYESLFSPASKEKVSTILTLASEALATLHSNPLEPIIPLTRVQTWSSWLFGLEKETVALNSQKKALQHERGRVVYFLENSQTYLERLVDLPRSCISLSDSDIEAIGNTFEMSASEVDSNNKDASSPNVPSTSISTVLRRGHFLPALLQRKGNPDLEPPRRDEVKFFVATLFKISLFLNKWVVPWAQHTYFEASFEGRLCRALLAPPVYYVHQAREESEDRVGTKNLVKKYLPPRVSLRPLGTQNLPIHVFVAGLALCFIGVRGLGWALFPISFFLLYIMIMAISEPRHTVANLRLEFNETLSDVNREAYFVTPITLAQGQLNARGPRKSSGTK